jgi:hypothetical protein
MSRPRLFMETLAARGLAEEARPLGAVSVGLSLIDAPQPRLIDGLTLMLRNTLCRRCDGVPESNRTCAACAAELVAAAERDAEARTVMTSLRGMFDPMTGRPAGGGW